MRPGIEVIGGDAAGTERRVRGTRPAPGRRRGAGGRWLLALLLGASAKSVRAQSSAAPELPRPLRLELTESYFQTDVEAEREWQQAGAPPFSLTHERLLVQPVLGLGVQGSVYHPNLADYRLNTELGLDYQSSRVDPGGAAQQSHFLQRYHGLVTLLREKPYAASGFADKDLTYRDYDFFSRVRVDSERYGARGGYLAGAVPVSLSVQHYDETLADVSRPSRNTEDLASVSASNHRRAGAASTQFDYNFNQFTRVDDGFSSQRGLSQTVSLSDQEDLAEHRAHASTLFTYNSITETAWPTAKLLVQEDLRLHLLPQLDNFYDYAYDHSSSGEATSDSHQFRLGLTHQARLGLLSTLDVHGDTLSAASPGNRSDSVRYGIALNEQYSRKLAYWANLSLGGRTGVDREDRRALGQARDIIDEPHVLTDGTLTLLSQPGVDPASIRVTDATGTILYQANLDYVVIAQGVLTEIRRIVGGRIPNGGRVLISYTSSVNANAAFSTFDNELNARLDLAKGLLGLYARWTSQTYSGGEQLLLRTLDDKVVGADTTWRWVRAGAECEWADSNLAPYARRRLFESAQIQPGNDSSLGVELDQTWTTFRDTGLHQTSIGALVRFQQALMTHLSWSAEGGVRFDRGQTFDQDVTTVRSSLEWSVGKLAVRLSYEFDQETRVNDERQRHYAFLRVRRDF